MEFDGASRGEPRMGGGGCILYNENMQIIYEIRVGLDDVSNNEAEYLALIHGMRTALHLGIKRLRVLGDLQLIVYQVGGDMKVVSILGMYHREAILLAQFFEVFEISEISRAENMLADMAAEDRFLFPAKSEDVSGAVYFGVSMSYALGGIIWNQPVDRHVFW